MKFTPCRNCYKQRVPGYFSKINDGYETLIECECHKTWKIKNELSIKVKSSGLSEDDLDYDVETYAGNNSLENISKLKNYISNFRDLKNEAIYFFGSNGTQKTTVAKWVGVSLLKKGYSVQYVTMKSLIDVLIASFSDTDEESAFRKKQIDLYSNCDLLIIDEVFDKSKVTLFKSGYQIPFLDQFIRNRLDTLKKGILFISNKTIAQISAEGFGDSLQDLLERKVILRKSNLTFLDRFFNEVNRDNMKGVFD